MTKTKKLTAQQTQQSIAEYIIAHPGSTAAEIALGLGRVKSTVQFAVCRLKAAGQISVQRPFRGPFRHYPMSDASAAQQQFGVNRLVGMFDRCVMGVRGRASA